MSTRGGARVLRNRVLRAIQRGPDPEPARLCSRNSALHGRLLTRMQEEADAPVLGHMPGSATPSPSRRTCVIHS